MISFNHPFKNRKEKQEDDLGFGTKMTQSTSRLINKNGSFNVERRGIKGWALYQDLVEMPWTRFFVLVILFYIVINAVFAILFVRIGVHHVSGASDGTLIENFLKAFFFSIQTFTTVGYGSLSPDGLAANLVASIDALVGLMSFALMTGLFFARFSKPVARLLFSQKALIAPYQGGSSFQFRTVNQRNHKILDLEAKVTMTWIESKGNIRRRRFAGLKLERDKIFLFPLNWTLIHPIDEGSPLFGKTEADLKQMKVEFLVLIEGHDETYAQTVHTSSSYTWNEIEFGVRFKRMYHSENGRTVLDLDLIDAVEKIG